MSSRVSVTRRKTEYEYLQDTIIPEVNIADDYNSSTYDEREIGLPNEIVGKWDLTDNELDIYRKSIFNFLFNNDSTYYDESLVDMINAVKSGAGIIINNEYYEWDEIKDYIDIT